MALHLFFGKECQSFLAESPLARTKGMAPRSPNSRIYFSSAGIPMPFCEVMMPSTTSSTTIAATTNAVFANLLITHSALNPVSGATFKVLHILRLQSYNIQVQPFCTTHNFIGRIWHDGSPPWCCYSNSFPGMRPKGFVFCPPCDDWLVPDASPRSDEGCASGRHRSSCSSHHLG